MTTLTLRTNPIKLARLEASIPTVEAMANIANIQKAAITQLEDGLQLKPLPSYLIAMGINPHSSEAKKLEEAYLAWQIEKRQYNGANGLRKLILNPTFYSNRNPIKTWREQSGLAIYGICSAFCLHLPFYNKYEKDTLLFRHPLPPQIIKPLTEAGYDLEEFEEATILFYSQNRNRMLELNDLPA